MSKYTVKKGQNLYDIALELHGSIEGIFDLLVSNENISLNDELPKGLELTWHESFVVNNDIQEWLSNNNIVPKNGQYQLNELSIKETIAQWIDKTNKSTKLSATIDAISTEIEESATWSEGKEVSPSEPLEPFESYDTEMTALNEEIKDASQSGILDGAQGGGDAIIFDRQEITDVSSEEMSTIEDATGITFGQIDKNMAIEATEKLYSNGLIILPDDKDELELYYQEMSKPKIMIVQTGNSCQFKVQIPANKFIAIDWGDGSDLDFYHYKNETVRISHSYQDTQEHTILIYGHSTFTNLNLMGINGIYYALTEIYVEKQFVTPYSSVSELNKLFIIKG